MRWSVVRAHARDDAQSSRWWVVDESEVDAEGGEEGERGEQVEDSGEETGEDDNESKVGTEGKAVDELLSFHSAGRARDGKREAASGGGGLQTRGRDTCKLRRI